VTFPQSYCVRSKHVPVKLDSFTKLLRTQQTCSGKAGFVHKVTACIYTSPKRSFRRRNVDTLTETLMPILKVLVPDNLILQISNTIFRRFREEQQKWCLISETPLINKSVQYLTADELSCRNLTEVTKVRERYQILSCSRIRPWRSGG